MLYCALFIPKFTNAVVIIKISMSLLVRTKRHPSTKSVQNDAIAPFPMCSSSEDNLLLMVNFLLIRIWEAEIPAIIYRIAEIINGTHAPNEYSIPPTGLPIMVMVASLPSLTLLAFGYSRISIMDRNIASVAPPKQPVNNDEVNIMARNTENVSDPESSNIPVVPPQ